MPHTNRKKKKKMSGPSRKRVEVEGEDGWTRITSLPNGRRVREVYITDFKIPIGMKESVHERGAPAKEAMLVEASFASSYEPMERDSEVSLDSLKTLYERLTKRFVDSELWKALENIIHTKMSFEKEPIKQCAVTGSGSLSGFKEGWIARHETSMVQVILLKQVAEAISRMQQQQQNNNNNNNSTKVSLYAQEPQYNDLDTEFLDTISIKTIAHPAAFEFPPASTLYYMPNSELSVEMLVLSMQPQILITNGALDFYWRNEQGFAVTDRVRVCLDLHMCEGEAEADADAERNAERDAEEETEGDGKKERDKEKEAAHEKEQEDQGKVRDGQRELSWHDEHLLVSSERNFRAMEAFNAVRQSMRLPEYEAKDLPFHHLHVHFPRDDEE